MEEQDKIDYDPIQSEVEKVKISKAFKSLLGFIKRLFSIYDVVDKQQTIQDIKNDISFSAINIWILICSIIIASIGLINNSTAVIIGAMLISPLMGPIRGIGYALSSNDFKVLITSLKNFGIMVVASLLASFIFFKVSPLKTETTELLSRTKPQVLDILIAFFGGLAGVIAATVRNKSTTITVIPGVAIATALMPPLCTVGFGLALWKFDYFIDALYLFLLNSVFICLATYVVLRLLSFPKVQYVNPKIERKVKGYVFVILLLIVIPSVFKFYNIIQESIFIQNTERFISEQVTIDNGIILSENNTVMIYDKEVPKITLNIDGKYVNSEIQKLWRLQLKKYDLGNVEFIVHNLQPKPIDEQQLLNKILVNNDEKIESLYKEMIDYKKVLQYIDEDNSKLNDLNNRILAHFPEVQKLNYGRSFSQNEGSYDTSYVFIVDWINDTVTNINYQSLENFVNEELNLIYNKSNVALIFHQ
tara:strand:- start:6967 stop:8391 length:1425 start_codon:yes stop_codon:yes gene_type:complete